MNLIVKMAQEQIDCIECMKQQKVLNEDIVKLKNFVAKHKPSPHGCKKTIEANEQYRKELNEWDNLMRL